MSHFEKFYLETNEFSGCEGMGVGIQTKRGMRWVFQDFFDAAGSSFMISGSMIPTRQGVLDFLHFDGDDNQEVCAIGG